MLPRTPTRCIPAVRRVGRGHPSAQDLLRPELGSGRASPYPSGELGSDWEQVAQEEVSPEAVAIEALVLDAGKRDPNLGAALYRARAASWEFGNRYLADNPAAATLRRLAITAEVAQALLPAREFDVLYGPMANYIDAGSSQRRNTNGASRSVAIRSAGLSQLRIFRGRRFSSASTRAMSPAVWTDRSVPLGK